MFHCIGLFSAANKLLAASYKLNTKVVIHYFGEGGPYTKSLRVLQHLSIQFVCETSLKV